MDMTRDALQYVVGLSEANLLTINGDTYTDKQIHRIDNELRAAAIEMNTLSSLIDYAKAFTNEMSDQMLVQVVSPTEVKLISCLDRDRKRECLVNVAAMVPEFSYGRYMDHESFIIALQSKFIPNDHRADLLRFAGTVKDESVAQYGDDGITQKATVKRGIASVEEAIVPNPVNLKPFRTFVEVDQPESAFIFRMKQSEGRGIECAIFEADGGAWKNEAMRNIKKYLGFALKELPQFTVIS
ncbi:hypothetical protein [Lacrimispora sp.]|uniref:hypothetical protein n=1 Tax=Lacrimispora sp. TaxID=2719234 RepID=UPI0039934EAF